MINPFNPEQQAGERIWITDDTLKIKAIAAETGGANTMIEVIASPVIGISTHVHKNEDVTLA